MKIDRRIKHLLVKLNKARNFGVNWILQFKLLKKKSPLKHICDLRRIPSSPSANPFFNRLPRIKFLYYGKSISSFPVLMAVGSIWLPFSQHIWRTIIVKLPHSCYSPGKAANPLRTSSENLSSGPLIPKSFLRVQSLLQVVCVLFNGMVSNEAPSAGEFWVLREER